MIVKPETLIGWHRKGFKLFWKWKCRVGRPRLPGNIRQLIVRMARENPTWGEERVAAELSVKLRILVSPRTVRSYWPSQPSPRGPRRISSQHWRTFIHNHAESLVACDFLVAVTARFRVLYVFVMMEVGSRRILHYNVTAHPTGGWTVQQFREAFPSDHNYRKLELLPLGSDAENDSTLYHVEFSELLPLEGAQGVALKVTEPAGNPCCDGPESRSGETWRVFADSPHGVTELLSVTTARDDSSHSDDPDVDSETTYRAQITRHAQNRGREVVATFREEVKDITYEGEKADPHTVSQRSGTLRYRWIPASLHFEEIK